MHAFHSSTATLRLFVCAFAMANLSQCAHSKKATFDHALSGTGWYIASQNPPTFCPKGCTLPNSGSPEAARAEYIQMPDRLTRYYIPPGCARHRQIALQLRHHATHSGGSAGEVVQGAVAGFAAVVFYAVATPYYILDWWAQARLEVCWEREEKRRAHEALEDAAHPVTTTRKKPPASL